MHLDVEGLEKLDGLEVFAATEAVRLPLPLLTAVVEVEHRGHRVDPQPVNVVVLQPKQRARDQVVGHFVTAVVVDQRAPVGMLPPPRVFVLIERRAVKLPQAVAILGEMGGHPVDDHAHAGPVQCVDQRHQRLRRAEAARCRVQADRLVAPARRQRMLRGGHELDMRKSHLDHVGHEFPLEVGVGEPAVRVVARSPPAAQVQFVDRQRGRERVAGGAACHPIAVMPLEGREIDHLRCRPRGHLGPETIGVGTVGMPTVGVHPELVERAGRKPGNEQFPDPRGDPLVHPMRRGMPAVEISHDRHAVGIRGPDGEVHTPHAVVRLKVGAEPLIALPMPSFAEQVQVVVGEHAGHGWRLEAGPYNRDTRQGFAPPRATQTTAGMPSVVTDATVEAGEDG